MTLKDLKKNKKKHTYYNIAIQMDSPYELNKETDSTFALIEEALKRDYTVFIYKVNKLSLIENKPKAIGKNVLSINIKKEQFIKLGKEKSINLEKFDFVLIRQDPPFNMNYITATYLLEKIKGITKVLNNPTAIRNNPEKLFVMDFFHLMPPTTITKNIKEINLFLNLHKKIVIKPLFGNGGKDVFFLNLKDPNKKVIIDKLLSDGEHLIVQKFLNKVTLGDKRILLINGSPVGAINRVPNKNEIRANLHIGAKPKKIELSKKDLIICDEVGPYLKSKGLFFTGLDIIDGHLTEINVTSPTCIREIDFYNKTNISKLFWDKAVKLF